MNRRILIIGTGIEGLTTAFRLSSKGYHITLLEAETRHEENLTVSEVTRDETAGQEERGTRTNNKNSDPRPLVIHGFQHATYSLLKELGHESDLRALSPTPYEWLCSSSRPARFSRFPAPTPFHTLFGVLTFKGLPLRDRWHLLNFLEQIWEGATVLPQDLDMQSAHSWLLAIGQSEDAQTRVWDPLCRFLLGEPLILTSAGQFVTMLKHCFFSSRQDSHVSASPIGVQSLLTDPLWKRLTDLGVWRQSSPKVAQIQFDSTNVTGVRLLDGQTLSADWYVTALPPNTLTTLLPERLLARFAYFHNVTKLPQTSALIVHIHLRQSSKITTSRLVLSAGTFHWMTSCSEPRPNGHILWIACVSTGNADLLKRSDQELFELALTEAGRVFSFTPNFSGEHLAQYSVIRHPHAFLAARPGISTYRPLQQSPTSNLLLAGDWTDTGLSASLESAIVSGNLCAQTIVTK